MTQLLDAKETYEEVQTRRKKQQELLLPAGVAIVQGASASCFFGTRQLLEAYVRG